MDQAISKLLFIAASIAIAAGVTGVAWQTLSDNTPDTNKPSAVVYNNANNQVFCEAIEGVWSGTSCSAPPSTP